MARKIDVILSAMDNMSPVIDKATDSTERLEDQIKETAESGSDSANKLDLSFAKVSAGIAVAGAAMVAYADSQKELASQSGRAAVQLGMTDDEFKKLAISVSDASLPLNEAVQLLAYAGKQGLQSKEELTQFTDFWADLGNATGESSTELAKMSYGLRAMGIEAGNESQALSAYGMVIKNTSLEIGQFNELTAKNATIAKQHGLSIDDMAAAYAYMGNELGYTAEIMEQEFEATIISSLPAIRKYKESIGDTSGVVGEMSKAHDDSLGIFDKFKQGLSEISLKYSDQIQLAGSFGTILTGVSSALSIASAAQGLYAAATATTGIASAAAAPGVLAFAGGVIAATWPILAIIAAIAAVIAIIVLIVKHFDGLKQAFKGTFDFMANVAKVVGPIIFTPFMFFIDILIKSFEFIKKNWDNLMAGMTKALKIAVDIMTLPFKAFVNGIITGINLVISAINMLGGNIQKLEKFDLSIGDMNLSRSSTQNINVNTTTTLDGREIAKSTASTTRRITASSNL